MLNRELVQYGKPTKVERLPFPNPLAYRNDLRLFPQLLKR